MAHSNETLTAQLKEACKAAPARWAVWLNHTGSGWVFGVQHGLSRTRQKALARFIRQPKTATWLGGTISSGRVRFCQAGESRDVLGCKRLYAFPNLAAQMILVVGGDQMVRSSETLFKVLAFTPPEIPVEHPPEGYTDLTRDGSLSLRPWEAGLEVSNNPEGVLENVLEFLVGTISCEAALMSIRYGDMFRVEAVWKGPASLRGIDISIRESETLAEMAVTRQGLILNNTSAIPMDRAHQELSASLAHEACAMLGLPIVIGQRVIGHLAFVSSQANSFSFTDLQRVSLQAGRLAYVIENAIVFAEAARYLQQFALLNELASAASLGVDANEVSRRVMQRLRRTFQTERAGVFMLSPDGRMMREYGVEGSERPPQSIPVQTSVVGYVVESGLPLRAGPLDEVPGRVRFPVGAPRDRAELAVPLKYRGKVIGALALESTPGYTFSLQDEQLLVLIASHLAGLFENMRLNEETRERAHNLNLIHQVVRRVIGLTDLEEIAQVASDLMVKRFSYETAAVVLVDEHSKDWVVGSACASGAADENLLPPDGKNGEKSGRIGIICKVLDTGQSCLLGDVSTDPAYAGHPAQPAASQMCVPLREGERVLGALDVGLSRKHAFSENDLLALDALAGVMSSVVLSALRYQQLQYSVRQLTAVRETALDIAADLDLDALLKRVVHRARDLVGVKGAELGLLDEQEQIVRIVVSETPWYGEQDNKIPLLAGVAGRVAAFGEPLVVDDYNNWSGRLYPEREAPFRTVAGVPFKYQGKVIGTLTVIDDRPDWKFRPEHVQLLELLAPQVTVWIRNAMLYQELQERIEAQRLAENRLIRSARLAAVGEMAAGVAHEMNNPLTTITGFVELILDELPPDSPHREDLDLVLREAHRARGVVRRMLDFSRPVENQRTRSDIYELVTDVLTLVNHLARTGGVEIVTKPWDGPQPLPWISVDPSQIKQVLLNLIHNGIQAMPGGGCLEIKTGMSGATYPGSSQSQDWVTVSVTDAGEGIPPENLEAIFEPFFTTRPTGGGTGLGLSVSYGIVSDHGGFIEVESELQKGSCFTVFLPVESEPRNE